ncbi:MAG: GNAT family N-acetyltransferase, partial [Mangrovimonas sp.]|nr:GNAT family N-acetyltransferase [Mangrovimonas sp.]
MLEYRIKSYSDLTKDELYALLQLRSEVFVVEQNCVYQDIDGKDPKAFHVLGFKNEVLIAYTRLFKPGDYFKEASIGRVV